MISAAFKPNLVFLRSAPVRRSFRGRKFATALKQKQ